MGEVLNWGTAVEMWDLVGETIVVMYEINGYEENVRNVVNFFFQKSFIIFNPQKKVEYQSNLCLNFIQFLFQFLY